MLEGLRNNERKEAWAVVQALDSANFVFSHFDQWLKVNSFQEQPVGKYFTYKGTYGYVQAESTTLGSEIKVVLCAYIPFTDTHKAYFLITEGVSTSGKSLSNKELELLKLYRYKQVEVVCHKHN